ncbi:MAG TPA: YcnI family protein [Mycobacterium sp.]|jgi:uncharacterized protein YcnI
MHTISRALQRALILVGVGAAALVGAAPAAAHVRVDADHAAAGEWAMLTFRVPNESENGSLTTQLNIAMPQGTSAMVEGVPGWTVKSDRDVAAGTVRSVTWTANPGSGVAPDQFALFRVSLKLPQADTVSFAATQTYSDGTVVKWDQATSPGGGEPEHPAPTLTLPTDPAPTQSDDTALWLAVAALVVASAAVVLAVLRRRS